MLAIALVLALFLLGIFIYYIVTISVKSGRSHQNVLKLDRCEQLCKGRTDIIGKAQCLMSCATIDDCDDFCRSYQPEFREECTRKCYSGFYIKPHRCSDVCNDQFPYHENEESSVTEQRQKCLEKCID